MMLIIISSILVDEMNIEEMLIPNELVANKIAVINEQQPKVELKQHMRKAVKLEPYK